MITLSSIDHVNASPERVWQFLTHLYEGDAYLRRHPADHKAFWLLSGDGQTVSSTFNAVEMLGGKKFSLKYRLNRVEPMKYLEYSAAGLLRSLRLATGIFTLKSLGKNKTELIANVYLGYKLPVIDWIISASVNIAAIAKHISEEGHYLNKTLATKEG